MGTRADFYVGKGKHAEWLGSVGFDGYPDGFERSMPLAAKSEEEWREEVSKEIASRDDGTAPEQGWPWPWRDSRTTDYAYTFHEGKVWCSVFGRQWWEVDTEAERFGGPAKDSEYWDAPKTEEWPDMSERQRVTLGARSGVMVIGGGR